MEFTHHANLRLVERGIAIDEVLQAVRRGAKTRRGAVFVARHARLSVAFQQRPCHQRVITAYWED